MLRWMSLVFIGTPAFAVPSLRRLAASGYQVSAVITQPDRPAGRGRGVLPPAVKLAADALNLPVHQPETLRDPATLTLLRDLEPEVMVAVAYGQILRPEVLDIAARGVVNVHPSLLPRWRGASPIPGAILAGDEETGVTIMLMDRGMDSGPILSQTHVPISARDTTLSLTDALADVGADLLARTLPRWLRGEITPQPQDKALATITRLVRKEDGVIDWSLSATEIWRRVRAYNPWPGAFTTLDGESVHIWTAWPLPADSGEPPGTIVASPQAHPDAAGAAFAVQTGDGLLGIIEAQRSGRRRLSAAEFLRGMPGILGRRFDSA